MQAGTLPYAAARPQKLIITDTPKQEILDPFSRLLESTRSISWHVVSLITDQFSLPELARLASSFSNVEEFSFSWKFGPFEAPCLDNWILQMRSLVFLEIYWVTNMKSVLLCAAASCPKLRRLQIVFPAAPEASFAALGGALRSLRSLETLVLPVLMPEISDLADTIGVEEFAQGPADFYLNEIIAALPAQLQDLKHLFLHDNPGDGTTVTISLFGLLYRHCLTDEAAEFVLNRLGRAAIDAVDSSASRSTPLFQLLSYSKGIPGRCQSLIAAGANPFLRQPVPCAVYNCNAIGNALHCAQANPGYAKELLQAIDFAGAAADLIPKLRTSRGFTPLHTAVHFGSWKVLYDKFVGFHPGILSDRANIKNMTPLRSIHNAGTRDPIPQEALRVAQFVIAERPSAIDEALPDLFADMLTFYGTYLMGVHRRAQATELLKVVLERLKVYLVSNSLIPSVSTPLSRLQLGFSNDVDPDDPYAVAYPILGALIFYREIVPTMIKDCTETILSATLMLVVRWRSYLPSYRDDIDTLLRTGAKINPVLPGLFFGVSPLYLFSLTALEVHPDDVPFLEPAEIREAIFWRDFHALCRLGADLELDGESISVFQRTGFGVPAMLTTWAPSSRYLEHYLQFLAGRTIGLETRTADISATIQLAGEGNHETIREFLTQNVRKNDHALYCSLLRCVAGLYFVDYEAAEADQ